MNYVGGEMSIRLMALFFALCLLICICLIGRTPSAQAQRTSAKQNSAKQKWEYCAIVSSLSMREDESAAAAAKIVYFDTSGGREESVKVQGARIGKTDGSHEYRQAEYKALAIAIAQLGDQGWDMIGQLPYNAYFRTGVEQATALYFKRSKE